MNSILHRNRIRGLPHIGAAANSWEAGRSLFRAGNLTDGNAKGGSQSCLRGGASMRFHPKRRVSMDHNPGPNIAREPPMVPNRAGTNISPGSVRSCHSSTAATNMPAIGVQRPAMRRSPHPASNAALIAVLIGGSCQSVEIALNISAEPTTRRMRSNPMPGQPPANVEYRRRTQAPFRTSIGSFFAKKSETPKGVQIITLWSSAIRAGGGSYSSMIPLLRPIIAACVRSLAPSFERMDLTRLLTVSSVIES